MDIENGKRLDSVIRALAHCAANPDPSEGFTSIVTHLEQGRVRAEGLASQQRAGRLEARAAVAHRKQLRRSIHQTLLVPISRIAEDAAAEEPELDKVFKLPVAKARSQVWRTAARAFATEVSSRKELFLRHGLSEPMFADLIAALDGYDLATDRANAGRRAHVGATAELDEVMRDNMRLVDLLDGLNRYRFKDDGEKLAAWVSARSLPTPAPTTEPPADELKAA